MKKIIYLFFICYLTIHLSSCVSGSGELTGRTTTRLMYSIEPNHGMVKLPGGSFTMGANDQDVPYSNRNNLKTIPISPFWIDQTEITNDEYRQFVLADGRNVNHLFSGDLPKNTNNNAFHYEILSDTSEQGYITKLFIMSDVDESSPSYEEYRLGEI